MVTATLSEPVVAKPDGPYEIVDGIWVEKRMSAFSVWIANKLAQHMERFAEARNLGGVYLEMMFILDVPSNLRRCPDLAFVSADRWPLDRLPPFETDWAIAPDLAVEVISPSNTVRDLVRKVREYFEHGVREVWVIVPDERVVYVYHSARELKVLRESDTLSTECLPGWSMAVGAVIPAIPRDSDGSNGSAQSGSVHPS